MTSIEKILEVLSKVRKDHDRNKTYSLKIVTDWLDTKNISYEYRSAHVDSLKIYEHGVVIKLPGNSERSLSIQTHPSVAGWAFAETLMTHDLYSDVRHKTPEDLFTYITEWLCTEVIKEKEDDQEILS